MFASTRSSTQTDTLDNLGLDSCRLTAVGALSLAHCNNGTLPALLSSCKLDAVGLAGVAQIFLFVWREASILLDLTSDPPCRGGVVRIREGGVHCRATANLLLRFLLLLYNIKVLHDVLKLCASFDVIQ